MVAAIAIVAVISIAAFYVIFKVADWATPGNLGKQIAPENGANMPYQQPNACLTAIVCTMIRGFALVLAATIIGVFFH
jgi:hypothetical protein